MQTIRPNRCLAKGAAVLLLLVLVCQVVAAEPTLARLSFWVPPELETLFGRLNRTMHGSLDARTYVCFAMGEVDLTERSFRLANSGCPYPFHFRVSAGDVSEMSMPIRWACSLKWPIRRLRRL